MGKIRYHASYVSTHAEPMEGLGGTVVFEIDDHGELEATDRAAYLLATSRPGELKDLVRTSNNRAVVWQQGMPIPGERITPDMVGMTFAEAIHRSRSCYQDLQQ